MARARNKAFQASTLGEGQLAVQAFQLLLACDGDGRLEHLPSVLAYPVVHRSFGGLSFRYIFVLFGMGDFGNISFNGTIDLWDASDIIIWDYRYRYNSLCMVDCPVGHVAK